MKHVVSVCTHRIPPAMLHWLLPTASHLTASSILLWPVLGEEPVRTASRGLLLTIGF